MTVFRAINPGAIWKRQLRPLSLQQFNRCADIFLFGLGETLPPYLEFIRVFDISFHVWNITYMEYIVNELNPDNLTALFAKRGLPSTQIRSSAF